MKMKKSNCRKIGLFAASAMVGISSALILTTTSMQSQAITKNVNQVNTSARATNNNVVIGMDKFASYNYNNAFSKAYNSSFALGVNTLTSSSDWTNGQLLYSSSEGVVQFKAWYQDDYRRTISNTQSVVADPFAVMQSGNMDISDNMIALKCNDLLNGSVQEKEALSSMTNTGGAITWNGITDWDAAGNESTIDEYEANQMGKVICELSIEDNTSISAAINIGSNNSGTMASELRYNTSGGLTDDSNKITSCSELSQVVDNTNNYAGLTFVRSSINGSTPGAQMVAVYSGDTVFNGNAINYIDINVPASQKSSLSASQWLSKNKTAFDGKIAIDMTNGFPGVLTNSLSIVPNNKTGEIKAVFKPITVLKSGSVVNYTGKSYEKVLVSGFNTNIQVDEDSNSDLWMWVGIGVGSAVVVAAIITTVILVLKKKKSSKKDLKVNSVSSNNKRLGLTNNTPPRAPGQNNIQKPAPRPGTAPQRPGPSASKPGPAPRPGGHVPPPTGSRPMPPRR